MGKLRYRVVNWHDRCQKVCGRGREPSFPYLQIYILAFGPYLFILLPLIVPIINIFKWITSQLTNMLPSVKHPWPKTFKKTNNKVTDNGTLNSIWNWIGSKRRVWCKAITWPKWLIYKAPGNGNGPGRTSWITVLAWPCCISIVKLHKLTTVLYNQYILPYSHECSSIHVCLLIGVASFLGLWFWKSIFV